MAQRKSVVIVGGGYAGLRTSKLLARDFKVTVIDKKSFFFHNMASLRGCVDQEFVTQIMIPYPKLLEGIQFVQGEVSAVSATEVHVIGGTKPLAFDFLVLATGTNYNFPGKIPWWAGRSPAVRAFQSVNKAIREAQHILVIGGGPVGCELAGELSTEFKGKKVTLVHSHEELTVDVLKPAFKAKIRQHLENKGVELLLGSRVVLAPDADGVADEAKAQMPEEFATVKEAHYRTMDGTEIACDLTFQCTGATVNNAVFQEHLGSSLDEQGRVMVNPFFQVLGCPNGNVFALGDCCNTAELKLGYLAMVHAEYVAAHIKRMAAGKQPKKVYTPRAPTLSLPLGRDAGSFQIHGLVLGSKITHAIRGEDLMLSYMVGMLGTKKPAASGRTFLGCLSEPKVAAED